jgi:predicted nucleic acid-binding protein
MLVYLDSVIIIYAIEGKAPFRSRALTHLANLQSAGHGFAASALSRQECRMKPTRNKDIAVLAEFDRFFADPALTLLSLSDPVFEMAMQIQALNNFKTVDSLHLATAILGGCDQFLTNDLRLARFTDIPVDVLP